jgi:hypothetical protein
MRTYTCYSSLLFALLLAFAGISNPHAAALAPLAAQPAGHTYASSSLSEEKIPEGFLAQRGGELVVSPLTSLPAPVSKIFPHTFLGGSSSIEARNRNQASLLLSRAAHTYPNLTVGVLIFPFHHFL